MGWRIATTWDTTQFCVCSLRRLIFQWQNPSSNNNRIAKIELSQENRLHVRTRQSLPAGHERMSQFGQKNAKNLNHSSAFVKPNFIIVHCHDLKRIYSSSAKEQLEWIGGKFFRRKLVGSLRCKIWYESTLSAVPVDAADATIMLGYGPPGTWKIRLIILVCRIIVWGFMLESCVRICKLCYQAGSCALSEMLFLCLCLSPDYRTLL